MTIQTRETNPPTLQLNDLIGELKTMIDQARESIASTVNTRLAMLYWHVGSRVRKEILKDERAEYGRTIVASVARQLTLQYGKGFSEKSLRRMIQFGEVFPDQQIVASLLRQLSWTHFTLLLPIKDSIKRDFYSEMCRIEKWNVRTLEKKIDSMLYERTALSKKPEALAQIELDALRKEDRLGWRALKSFLDFARKKHPPEEVAFIEHVFPKKMRVFHSRIKGLNLYKRLGFKEVCIFEEYAWTK